MVRSHLCFHGRQLSSRSGPIRTQISLAQMTVLSVCGWSQEHPDENAATNRAERPSSAPLESRLQRIDELATAERDREQCNSWNFDEQELQVDLAKMRPVAQAKWGRTCYQYSCSYQGKTQIEGTEKFLVVNAGGWMSLVKTGVRSTSQATSNFLAFLLGAIAAKKHLAQAANRP